MPHLVGPLHCLPRVNSKFTFSFHHLAILKQEDSDKNKWLFFYAGCNKNLPSYYRFGYGNGKACLLRTICDASSIPFDSKSGLLAEIAHALLTWDIALFYGAFSFFNKTPCLQTFVYKWRRWQPHRPWVPFRRETRKRGGQVRDIISGMQLQFHAAIQQILVLTRNKTNTSCLDTHLFPPPNPTNKAPFEFPFTREKLKH